MRVLFYPLLILLFIGSAFSQENNAYRYDTDYPEAKVFSQRRDSLRRMMPVNSVGFLFAAPVRNRSNDVDYVYHQNPDFFYLTGITSPNCLLMIYSRDSSGAEINKDVLFIPAREKEKELWTGRMIAKDEATSISGIGKILFTNEFFDYEFAPEKFNLILYTNLPSGLVDSKADTCDLFDIVASFKKKTNYPPSNGDSFKLKKMISSMREIKDETEITLLKKAISISCLAHMEMMKSLQPGMHEYEVQAAGEYVFKSFGSEYVGYPSICGGGENSCILHYETNRRKLKEGDLILLDMGAEYHGYTADVTRTLPVSGRFTSEQKIIYNLVKEAQDSAFSKCAPGYDFRDPHRAAVSVIARGLKSLGIINNENDYSTYFMHGTSHYLGLDVHDVGSHGKLRPGNVITVEPGIYIPAQSNCDPKWWNIGIRIEDDVLITGTGFENLSESCPSGAEEVEKLMSKSPEHFKQSK